MTIALVVALVALVTFALAFRRPVWWVRQVLMVDEGPPSGDGSAGKKLRIAQGELPSGYCISQIYIYI